MSSLIIIFVLKRDNLGNKGLSKRGIIVASLLAVAPDVNSSRYSSLRSSLPGSLQQYRLPFFVRYKFPAPPPPRDTEGHIFNTFIGLLVYWFIGLLVYWFIGLLVYWFILFWYKIYIEKGQPVQQGLSKGGHIFNTFICLLIGLSSLIIKIVLKRDNL